MHVGSIAAAWIALQGDLPGTVHALAATNSFILFPFKFAVSYTILYHWLGAMRHFAWDHHKIGNQVRAGPPTHARLVAWGGGGGDCHLLLPIGQACCPRTVAPLQIASSTGRSRHR